MYIYIYIYIHAREHGTCQILRHDPMKKYTETREAARDVLPRVVEVLIPLSSFSVEVLKTELLRALLAANFG